MKMNLVLRKSGRLGNFLIRIRNALHVALFYKYNIILKKHAFINTTYIVINPKINLEAEKFIDSSSFWDRSKIKNIDTSLFEKNKDKVTNIMKDIFTIKKIKPFGINDLVIHIRSGDIFEKSGSHGGYVMPPLSYYKNIIDKNNFNNIILIAEDTGNPCIPHLLNLYPKIMFKLRTLEKDVTIALGAVNMALSFGSFIPELLNISDNIKNVYCPDYCPYRKTGCNTHITKLMKYYAKLTPWGNTPEQIEIMLNYEC